MSTLCSGELNKTEVKSVQKTEQLPKAKILKTNRKNPRQQQDELQRCHQNGGSKTKHQQTCAEQ